MLPERRGPSPWGNGPFLVCRSEPAMDVDEEAAGAWPDADRHGMSPPAISVEQSILDMGRGIEAQMLPAEGVQAAPPRRAGDQAKLDEIGFDHFLYRFARFGKAGGQRLDTHRPAAIEDRKSHVQGKSVAFRVN